MNKETQLPPGYTSELSTKHPADVMTGVDETSLRPAANYWLAQELLTILRLIRVDKPVASAILMLGGVYLVAVWQQYFHLARCVLQWLRFSS